MICRISDRATFEALRNRSQRGRNGPVSVAFCASDDPGVARVAYAISRRAGCAVERNRLRRRLKAVMATMAPDLPSGAYLVKARGEASRLSFGDLKSVLVHAVSGATRKTFQNPAYSSDTTTMRTYRSDIPLSVAVGYQKVVRTAR